MPRVSPLPALLLHVALLLCVLREAVALSSRYRPGAEDRHEVRSSVASQMAQSGLSDSEFEALQSEATFEKMPQLLEAASLLRGLHDVVPPRDGIPQGVDCDEDMW